jgi:hypothetical protein
MTALGKLGIIEPYIHTLDQARRPHSLLDGGEKCAGLWVIFVADQSAAMRGISEAVCRKTVFGQMVIAVFAPSPAPARSL